jgi:hypothetical protein
LSWFHLASSDQSAGIKWTGDGENSAVGSVRLAAEDCNGRNDQCSVVTRNRSIREVLAIFKADAGGIVPLTRRSDEGPDSPVETVQKDRPIDAAALEHLDDAIPDITCAL